MRKLAVFAALVLCLSLAACGGKVGTDALAEGELLSVGSAVCTREEALIFLISQRSIYSRDYGDSIFSVELERGKFADLVKEALLDYLETLFFVDESARESGIELSEAERSLTQRAAESFLACFSEEEKTRLGLTRELAEGAYARFARAQIFYRQAQEQTVAEISREEARAIKLQIVQLNRNQGMITAQSVAAQLQAGTPLAEVMKGIKGISSRQEILTRGMYEDPFDGFAFALKTDQWSTVITLSDGYYILHCLSPYEEEETAKNKAEMELAQREALLSEALTRCAEGKSLKINPRVWDSLSFGELEGLPLANFYDYVQPLLAAY